MDIIKVAADVVDWTIYKTAVSLQVFLDGNYYMVAFLIGICNVVTDSVADTLAFTSSVLHCYYIDFVAFLNELSVGIHFIGTAVVNFLLKIVFNIGSILGCIADAIYSLYVKIAVTAHTVNYYFFVGVDNVFYFINLLFAAILLILQLGPNLILLLCNVIFYCALCVVDYLHFCFYSISYCCIAFFSRCQHFIITIPPKAYLGVVLFIILYYVHKSIRRYIKLSIISLAGIVLQLLSYIWLALKRWFNKFESLRKRIWCHSENSGRTLENRHSFFARYVTNFLPYIKIPFWRNRNADQLFSSEKERFMCVVCQDKEKNTLLIPCRHLCMCEDCTATIQESYLGCPLCRKQILDTVRVYT